MEDKYVPEEILIPLDDLDSYGIPRYQAVQESPVADNDATAPQSWTVPEDAAPPPASSERWGSNRHSQLSEPPPESVGESNRPVSFQEEQTEFTFNDDADDLPDAPPVGDDYTKQVRIQEPTAPPGGDDDYYSNQVSMPESHPRAEYAHDSYVNVIPSSPQPVVTEREVESNGVSPAERLLPDRRREKMAQQLSRELWMATLVAALVNLPFGLCACVAACHGQSLNRAGSYDKAGLYRDMACRLGSVGILMTLVVAGFLVLYVFVINNVSPSSVFV